MSKLSKALKAIGLILKKPILLNTVLNTPDVWNEYVLKKYQKTTGLPVVKPEQLFDITEKTVSPYSFTEGGSLITDILLLKNAAASFNNCFFFEFGTWRGETSANIASVAKKCFTLNLSDEEMKALNLSQDYINQIGLFSEEKENIVHLKGNSLTFNYSELNTKFDLIFIDGNHHYDFVKSDTENTFKYLTHENSIVIWHDYAYNPEKVRFPVLAGILDGTPEEKHSNLYHVKGTMCAVYIPKKIKGEILIPQSVPDFIFEIKTQTFKR